MPYFCPNPWGLRSNHPWLVWDENVSPNAGRVYKTIVATNVTFVVRTGINGFCHGIVAHAETLQGADTLLDAQGIPLCLELRKGYFYFRYLWLIRRRVARCHELRGYPDRAMRFIA